MKLIIETFFDNFKKELQSEKVDGKQYAAKIKEPQTLELKFSVNFKISSFIIFIFVQYLVAQLFTMSLVYYSSF